MKNIEKWVCFQLNRCKKICLFIIVFIFLLTGCSSAENENRDSLLNELDNSDQCLAEQNETIDNILEQAYLKLNEKKNYTYVIAEKEERDRQYKAFLEGTEKAVKSKNVGSIPDVVYSFEEGTLEELKRQAELQLNEDFSQVMTNVMPFDDGNEMLIVTMSNGAALSTKIILTLQATSEGIIIVSQDFEYDNRTSNHYKNGVILNQWSGDYVSHYSELIKLTNNCERLCVMKWNQMPADSFEKSAIDYDEVFISELMVGDVAIYDLCITKDYNYEDIGKNYNDEEKINSFIKQAKLNPKMVIQDYDYLLEKKEEFEKKIDSQLNLEQWIGKEIDDAKELDFAGKWKIEKVAVIAEWYTGTTKDGLAEEDLYDSEDFLNVILEYRKDKIVIGNQEYPNPQYEFEKMTVMECDAAGGKFRVPSLYDCFEENNIELEKDEVTAVFVKFPYEAAYPPYSFIPVGKYIVLLNDEYMLVGDGKVLLAHKISD